jgi:hypothetical protein
MKHAAAILPPLLSAVLAAAAAAEEAFDIQVAAAVRERDGRSLVVAEGTTTLPDRSILKGVLHYVTGAAPQPGIDNPARAPGEPKKVELVMWREEVKDGKFEIPLDGGFKSALFPGLYAAAVTFDPSGQYPQVTAVVGRRIRSPLTRTATFRVGTPEEAESAVEERRRQWIGAMNTLETSGTALRVAFLQQVRRADPATWAAWAAAWRAGVQAVQAIEVNPGEAHILPFLSRVQFARDDLVRLVLDVADHAEAALKTTPPDLNNVQRVQQWLDYYGGRAGMAIVSLKLSKPDTARAAAILAQIDGLIRAVEEWHGQHRAGKDGYAAAEWAAWRDGWLEKMGDEINQFPDAGYTDLDAELEPLAAAAPAVAAAVGRSVGGADGDGVVRALTDARTALAKLGERIGAQK